MSQFKYTNWNIQQLKDALKKRGASLKGKKKDLQERLLAYDRNHNFGGSRDDDDPPMVCPDDKCYRDINADSIIPKITADYIKLFTERFSIHKERGKTMYDSGYLFNVRYAVTPEAFYFRTNCGASMKKHVQYQADVRFSLVDGFIDTSHCECAVGSGLSAHCKHVIVLLWALEAMGRGEKLKLKKTCTERIQTFHRPAKEYAGTPLKAENLARLKKDASDEQYVALDVSVIDKESYNQQVRNLCINFAAENPTTIPMMQLYEPANKYAAIWDHNYTGTDPENQLLIERKLLDVTDEDIATIERETRDQAMDEKWHKYRSSRITASKFYFACIQRNPQDQMKFARSLMNPIHFKSQATTYGRLKEPVAIAQCEQIFKQKIGKCGLYISKEYPFLGASPDGILMGEILVEVKCPYSQRRSVINETSIPYLKYDAVNGVLNLKKNHLYFFQAQGQLFATGKASAAMLKKKL